MQFSLSCIYVLLGLQVVSVSARFEEQYYNTASIPGKIVGFVDFNNDKLVDIISVYYRESTKDHCVQIYQFQNNQYELLTTAQQICEKQLITSVKVADLNYDGRPDLLIQGYSDTVSDTRYAHIYLGYQTFLTTTPVVILPIPYSEQSVLDVDNNQKPDLYGLTRDNGVNYRTIWQYVGEDTLQQPVYSSGRHTLPDNHPYTSLCEGMAPVYIDLDGDCLMDLLIPVCKAGQEGSAVAHVTATTPENSVFAWELWRNVKRSDYSNWAYQLDTVQPMPVGFQQPVILDAYGTGTLGIAAPYCYPLHSCTSGNTIYVWKNIQKSVCQTSLDKNCRSEDELCKSDNNYNQPIYDINQANILPVPTYVLPNITNTPLSYQNPSILLHVGDIDKTGLPFFSVPTLQGLILINVDKNMYTVTSAVAYAGAFLEIPSGKQYRGKHTVLVLPKVGAAVTFTDTTASADTYHLTTMASNGANIKSKPYGTPAIGATFKFLVTQLSSKITARQTVQVPCTPLLSLGTPYTISGLGASNQYLPKVYLGIPITSTHFQSWSGVLPNSEIVIFPDLSSLLNEWIIELFVPMVENIKPVAIAISIAIFINIIIIIVLRCRERVLEKQQSQKQRHLFAF